MSEDKPNAERERIRRAEENIADSLAAVIMDHVALRRSILKARDVIAASPYELIMLSGHLQLAGEALIMLSASEMRNELLKIEDYRKAVMRPRDSDGNVITAEDSGPGDD